MNKTLTLSRLLREVELFASQCEDEFPVCFNRGRNICQISEYFNDDRGRQPIHSWLWLRFLRHHGLSESQARTKYGVRNWRCFTLACETRPNRDTMLEDMQAHRRNRWFRKILINRLGLVCTKSSN